jgi:putative ABC transport system ATP-binding protein
VLKDGNVIKDYQNEKILSAAIELAKLPKQDD